MENRRRRDPFSGFFFLRTCSSAAYPLNLWITQFPPGLAGPARRSRTTERSELVSEEAEYHRPGIGILDAQ